MAITNESSNSEVIKTLYSKAFLLPFETNLRLYDAGQKEPIPIGSGQGSTIEHTRWMKLVIPTSALTTTSVTGTAASFTNPAPRTFYTQKVSTSLELWGDWIQETDVYNFEKINPGITVESGMLGNQSSELLEVQTHQKVCMDGLIPMRSDYNSDYEKHKQTVTTSTSTASWACSALDQATSYWNAGWCVFDHPAYDGYGYGCDISTFTSGGTIVPTTAVSKKPLANYSTLSIGTDTGLSAIITGTAIKRARRLLNNGTIPTYPGGFYNCYLDPDTEFDMMADPLWLAAQSTRTDQQGMFNGEIKRLWGVTFITGNFSYRWTEGDHSTYVADGALHTVPVVGPKCFGVVDAKGMGLRMIFKDFSQTADPLERYQTMGWKVLWNVTKLNATCGVGIMTGASA